jgi:hypothetical protein
MKKLPEQIENELSRFRDDLVSGLGDDLVSLVLYGPWSRDAAPAKDSDINLMIVVQEISTALLDKIAGPYHQNPHGQQMQLLTLSKTDLENSTDVFPIKFLRMQRCHQLIHGTDLLADLQVSRDHLRFRCEQEIKNLMLRLRYFYLLRNESPRAVRRTLLKARHSFESMLEVLIELKTGSPPTNPPEGDEVIGMDIRSLKDITRLSEGSSELPQLKELYERTMAMVRHAATIADQA